MVDDFFGLRNVTAHDSKLAQGYLKWRWNSRVIGNDGYISPHQVAWPLCAISPDVSINTRENNSVAIINPPGLWRTILSNSHVRSSRAGGVLSPVRARANTDIVVLEELSGVGEGVRPQSVEILDKEEPMN